MAGQAAEQIIAGVVLSERLAVTMYGAIHRAQFGGQRNLRGLVVDPKLLEEDVFRISLTDQKTIAKITRLEHPNIVSTVAVESGGPDVVIVTRGGSRYVTVQDLITSARARSKHGKLSMPVAGLIGKSVIEALAAAHQAGIIHGAVHPRSVLVEDDGSIRLGDFIVGRALTTAVSQGADSSLWRGLTGYIAPELVVGEEPATSVDVFAAAAMMFAMLSGEVPPGSLRVTPAIERLVQRALDTDPARRYKHANDMLENLLEALEDDRWELANRGELIREAGLSGTDDNIDDATEDLLASLGKSSMQVTASRKDVDAIGDAGPDRSMIRGGAKHRQKTGDSKRLDALIADLDDISSLTPVDNLAVPRDPISDVIRKGRVPSLDDPDDDAPRAASADERAAIAAIGDLDANRPRLPAREPAPVRSQPRISRPIVDPIQDVDAAPPRLRSPLKSAVFGLGLLAFVGVAGYLIYTKYHEDEAKAAAAKAERVKAKNQQDELEAKMRNAQPDSGALEISSGGAGIWLRLGRTPLDTPIQLPASQAHDLVLLHTGFEPTEAQVNGTTWSGPTKSPKAKLAVTLIKKSKQAPTLPLQPTTPVVASTGVVGAGPVHIESTPADAEAWLFIGAGHAQFNELISGRDYEVAVVKPGFKTQHLEVKAEEWRDGGDPNAPLDIAKKKAKLSRTVELEPDPDYKPPKKGK